MFTARRVGRGTLVLVAILSSAPVVAFGQDSTVPPGGDMKELSKATQNPVGDLVALPFQFNFNTGGDLEDRTSLNVNFQPVIPFKVSADWSVIARTIVPMDSIPTADGRASGIGDIQEQIYFTPAKPGAIIWGAGPVISMPTATASALESGTWAIGPGLVVVKNAGDFVLGGLVNQFFPISDSGAENETNLLVMQPFVNYNFGSGWALAFAPLITANWDASPGNEWTVPLGIGISRTTVFGQRPITLGAQYYYNVKRPDGAAATQLRLTISLLYPKAHHTTPRR